MSKAAEFVGRTVTDGDSVESATEILHSKIGVYTRTGAVDWFLDALGWTEEADLSSCNLLEPSAGNGAFLVRAVDRLCRSFGRMGREWTFASLAPRVLGIELHPNETHEAQRRVATVLRSHHIGGDLVNRLVVTWVRNDDFLLFDFGLTRFTHIVGNPPYLRWSLIPPSLRKIYECKLPRHAAKGDYSLAFLDRAIGLLGEKGRLGFLCNDRWLYTAYAEEFRNVVLQDIRIEKMEVAHDASNFERKVMAYPVRMVLARRDFADSERSTYPTVHLPRNEALATVRNMAKELSDIETGRMLNSSGSGTGTRTCVRRNT